MDSITISGVTMTMGAARNVEATGTNVAGDVARLRSGLSREDLLAECLDGCDDETTAADWREYVSSVSTAAADVASDERVIRSLARQDQAGDVDDSFARTGDALDTIRRWRQSAREGGDVALVETIDALGEDRAAEIYAQARE